MYVKILLLILSATSAVLIIDDTNDEDFPERQYMNLSVDPCDDFYEYACGNFKNIYPLDNDTLTIDHFTIVEEEVVKLVHLILSEDNFIDDPDALNKSKSAYKACVDIEYLNTVKNPELSVIYAENGFPLIEPNTGTVKYGFNDIGDAVSKYGIPMLFRVDSYVNLYDATKNVILIQSLDTTSLTPSQIRPHEAESYETIIEKGFLELNIPKSKLGYKSLKPFDIFLRKMALKLRNATKSSLTDEEVYKNIDPMVVFIRAIFSANFSAPNADNFPTNSTVTLKELNSWTKEQFNDTVDIDWVDFLQHLFANSGIQISDTTEVMNYNTLPDLLYGTIKLVQETDDRVIKNYVLMRIFTHLSPDSDEESRNYINEYITSLNGVILPRWKYCTRKIIDSVGTAGLSFAPAYEYQLRHFNVNKFKLAVELIQEVQSAFRGMLQANEWMDNESKSKAIEKLDNMITILAHPDISFSHNDLDNFYENLRICKWDNYGNSIRIKAFKNAYQISQVSKRDRAFWEKSPFEVNAYYNSANNKIIFPIAMLRPVFFGNNMSILDFGRIGAIIGHEITHGFDTKGMLYNPDGIYEKWWTDDTTNAYNNRTNCFIEEYNQFYNPEIDSYVNGSLTLNENIADNGGAKESYKAMKQMFQKYKYNFKGTKEFTTDQLFFIGFGTLWCNNPSVTYLEKMKTSDHARSKYRVNGVVSNMKEFSEAFNCPVGSQMNPSNKCILW